MNRGYKEFEINEYLGKAPAFGGIAYVLFGLMGFMDKSWKRSVDVINKLRSQTQSDRGIDHLGRRSHVSQPGARPK